jgi:hypothetical protein
MPGSQRAPWPWNGAAYGQCSRDVTDARWDAESPASSPLKRCFERREVALRRPMTSGNASEVVATAGASGGRRTMEGGFMAPNDYLNGLLGRRNTSGREVGEFCEEARSPGNRCALRVGPRAAFGGSPERRTRGLAHPKPLRLLRRRARPTLSLLDRMPLPRGLAGGVGLHRHLAARPESGAQSRTRPLFTRSDRHPAGSTRSAGGPRLRRADRPPPGARQRADRRPMPGR